MSIKLSLREFELNDLKHYFEFQKDRDANHMAAFTLKNPDNWDEFKLHWDKIINNELIIKKTILYDNRIVGNVLSFILENEREISYWIDKSFWGKGIATEAVKRFLSQIKDRPIYARAAFDNTASIRVLQKCGFKEIGEDKFFANARKAEIVEKIFILKK